MGAGAIAAHTAAALKNDLSTWLKVGIGQGKAMMKWIHGDGGREWRRSLEVS